MLAPRSNPLVLSALVVACALGSCRSSPQQLPRVDTAGLGVEVVHVKKAKAKKQVGNLVEVKAKIWNNHDIRISFEPEQVRLLYGSDEVAPLNAGAKPFEVPAKSPREFTWKFETPALLEQGTYAVEIRNLKKGDMPLGETAKFEIVVP